MDKSTRLAEMFEADHGARQQRAREGNVAVLEEHLSRTIAARAAALAEMESYPGRYGWGTTETLPDPGHVRGRLDAARAALAEARSESDV